MSELDENTLDTLLREQLSAQLNGQLGRSAAAFMAHVGPTAVGELPEESRPPMRLAGAVVRKPPTRSWRFDGWMLGLAGAAVAASIAVLWAAPAAFRGHGPVLPIRAVEPMGPAPSPMIARSDATPDGSAGNDLVGLPAHPPLIQWVQNQTLDEGTVVLDDPSHPVPARKLRQQQFEHTRWYDPAQRGQVEMTVPRENIKFVEMDTY